MYAEMKKIKIVISVSLLTLLFGCSSSFDKIQNGKVTIINETLSVQRLINNLTGIDGNIQWVLFEVEKNKGKVTYYQADIERKGQRENVQFAFNPDRNIFEVSSIVINGVHVSFEEMIFILKHVSQ
jgi:hypothetical protein